MVLISQRAAKLLRISTVLFIATSGVEQAKASGILAKNDDGIDVAPLMQDNTAIVSSVAGDANVNTLWTDSYSVGDGCYCTSNFDGGIDSVLVDTPLGTLTVKEICDLIGPGPGQHSGTYPVYNDIQCGNGPSKDAMDEVTCPGRTEYGKEGCGYIGPQWNFDKVLEDMATAPPTSAPTETPVEPTVLPFLLNAGIDDEEYVSGESWSSFYHTAIDVSKVVQYSEELFKLHRSGHAEFSYTIPGLVPGSEYRLILGFAENWNKACSAGDRVFDVTVNDSTFLTKMDIAKQAGGCYSALRRSRQVLANSKGEFVVKFIARAGNPMVSFLQIEATAQTAAGTDSPPTGSPTQRTAMPTTAPVIAPTNIPTVPNIFVESPAVDVDMPSVSPSSAPVITPTDAPIVATDTPTKSPSSSPIASTDMRSASPSSAPVNTSTDAPIVATAAPTAMPSSSPVASTNIPSASPSLAPIFSPTDAPIASTDMPTDSPTSSPIASTALPSSSPSSAPIVTPTDAPTVATDSPTDSPSNSPVASTDTPSASPTSAPVITPTDAPTSDAIVSRPIVVAPGGTCSFRGETDLAGDGSLLLRQGVNYATSTVTIELEYIGEGWIGFGFGPAMINTVAAVGLPGQGIEQRLLGGKFPQAIVATESQTLSDVVVDQQDGITRIRFTKPLVEDGQPAVVVGDNAIIWAIGRSNDFGYHAKRDNVVVSFDECA